MDENQLPYASRQLDGSHQSDIQEWSDKGGIPGLLTRAGRSSTLTFTIGSSPKMESTPWETFPFLKGILEGLKSDG